MIKLYAWEMPFINKVGDIRHKEISQLRKISYIKAISNFIWTGAPFIVTFASFAFYILSDPNNILDAKKAFVSLALFDLLRVPLTNLPDVINTVINAQVSITRLNRFLNSEQLQPYVTRKMESDRSLITIENGCFTWEKNCKNLTLRQVICNFL